MESVGKSIPRIDGIAKVCGKAKYVDDFFHADMLHAKIFRSTIANGWVKSIDVSKAKAMAGVEAVVTYEDVPKYKFPTAGHPYSQDPKHQDIADRNLLSQRIRLYGDEIAVVVAVDELTAEKALRLIEVEYEEYVPILTVEDAVKDDAVEIHDGTKNNVISSTNYQIGDIDEAFAQADYIFEDNYVTSMVQHCAMENHSAYGYIDENGKITVVSSTQIPHICRRIIGQALGIPWGRARVIKPYIGGGFGSKQDIVVEPLVAFLTTVVHGRTVKLEFSREETFIASRVRHAIKFNFKTGVNKDGTLVARQLKAIANNGAYASHGHSIVSNAITKFRQLYDQKTAIRGEATTVYTNLPTAGAMRGYGIPQITFGLESHMEDIARELKFDPIEFRLKNSNKEGYVDPLSGITSHSNGLAECIAKGKELINWDQKKANWPKQEGSKRRGLGMACFCYKTGTFPFGFEMAGARIVLNQDGSIQLQVGATEIGQGSDTVFAQMAAETIGIPFEMVTVVSSQDTDITPFDTGSYASRQTYVSGMAVKKAAEEIKTKILTCCQRMTDIPVNALDTREGWVIYKHNSEKVLDIAEVALDSYYHAVFAAPITADVTNNTRNNAISYGCTFVEVEVDIPTAKISIIEIYNIHDSGKIINPQLAEGQVHGGVSMGLGYALYEQMLFDPKTGKPLNSNLLDYKLMTTMDTPEIGTAFVETFEPTGPYGNKALGEPPAISPAPAIRNAIYDATGVKFYEVPMNPQRLFEKFQAAGLL
jgi:xanthine dehydrogenase molybdenum-binding subunit